MKKQFVLLSAVFVCASLFATGEQYSDQYSQWFDGLVIENESIGASDATWDFTQVTGESEKGVVGGKLELSLQSGVEATLTPTAEAADTNTITKVTIVTTFEPVETLASPGEGVQTAIVVHDGKYKAWNGSAWVELGTASATGVEVTMTVALSYQDFGGTSPDRSVTYTIGGTTYDPVVLSGAAQSADSLGRIACCGVATIADITADVMLGVAVAGEKKYGTIAEAMTAAGASESDKTVVLVRTTDEPVQASSDVKIDFNGQETGDVTIPENSTLEVAYGTAEAATEAGTSSGAAEIACPKGVTLLEKVDITIADDTKEIVPNSAKIEDSKIKFLVQTKSTVLAQVAPDGSNALDANPSAFRQFLERQQVSAYLGGHATSEKIAKGLKVAGSNNLPLWQDYVLGIEPTTVVKPVAASSADNAADGVTLAVPAIDPDKLSGDYAVKYQIDDSDKPAEAPVVPRETGIHRIKVILVAQ